MKLPRRNFLHLAAGAAALPTVSRIARAQAYPTRPVRIVVPFAPAGVNDITARLIGQWLSERLGQQFIVENRPGGGGNIGIEAVVRSPADGYTLLVVGTPAAINATLFEKLNYNFIRDIAPVDPQHEHLRSRCFVGSNHCGHERGHAWQYRRDVVTHARLAGSQSPSRAWLWPPALSNSIT